MTSAEVLPLLENQRSADMLADRAKTVAFGSTHDVQEGSTKEEMSRTFDLSRTEAQISMPGRTDSRNDTT